MGSEAELSVTPKMVPIDGEIVGQIVTYVKDQRYTERRMRDEASMERRTLTVEEAGQILGISRNTAYALATSGRLPTIRLGRRLLVPKAALDRLLDNTGAA
jgi:excisionase family DNA binding protein